MSRIHMDGQIEPWWTETDSDGSARGEYVRPQGSVGRLEI